MPQMSVKKSLSAVLTECNSVVIMELGVQLCSAYGTGSGTANCNRDGNIFTDFYLKTKVFLQYLD
jgi:hypothetical protein